MIEVYRPTLSRLERDAVLWAFGHAHDALVRTFGQNWYEMLNHIVAELEHPVEAGHG